MRRQGFPWVAAFLLAVAAGAGEGGWEETLENEARADINRLIRNLDVSAALRPATVKALAAACRGKYADLARREVLAALTGSNPQIRAGAVETLAEIGGEDVVFALAWQLRYEPCLEVRHLLLHVLCVSLIPRGDEALRAEMIARLVNGEPLFNSAIRAAVRRTPRHPVTREWDAERSRLQAAATAAIAGQLDPVAAVIEGLDSKKDDTPARLCLRQWFAKPLGETRQAWQEQWAARGPEILGPEPSEMLPDAKKYIASLQLAAARLLAEIKAPVSAEIALHLERLAAVASLASRQAGLTAAAELSRLARHDWFAYAQTSDAEAAELSEEEKIWRHQRREAAARAARLAFALASRYAEDAEPAVRAAACAAFGVSRLPGAPDEAATLAAALTALRERVVRNDEWQVQIAVAKALGELGGQEALKMLIELTHRQIAGSEHLLLSEAKQFFAAAIAAIAAIAEQGGESGLVACEHLCRLLSDNRPLPGKTDGREPQFIRDLALRSLQELHNLRDHSYDAEVWRRRYESLQPVSYTHLTLPTSNSV